MEAAGSGAHLGGIGTMLAQSEVCVLCGSVHPASKLKFRYLANDLGCPSVSVGSLPLFSPPPKEPTEDGSEESAVEPSPVFLGSVPVPRPSPAPRRSGIPALSWPAPTSSEEYFL